MNVEGDICCTDDDIKNRARLWESTVQNSVTCALETSRGSEINFKTIRSAQRRQLVRMICSKRQVLEGGAMEDWVSFQKRVYRRAIEIIDDCGQDACREVFETKTSWAMSSDFASETGKRT